VKRMLAVAGLMLASTGVVISTPASAQVHPTLCSLDAIVQARVVQLRPSVPFVVTTTREDAYGVAKRDRVEVSRETPCDYDLVISVVNHEYMHTLQYQSHKKFADFEKVADCGSRLLGSRVTPYLGDDACSDVEMMEARNLLTLYSSMHV